MRQSTSKRLDDLEKHVGAISRKEERVLLDKIFENPAALRRAQELTERWIDLLGVPSEQWPEQAIRDHEAFEEFLAKL